MTGGSTVIGDNWAAKTNEPLNGGSFGLISTGWFPDDLNISTVLVDCKL